MPFSPYFRLLTNVKWQLPSGDDDDDGDDDDGDGDGGDVELVITIMMMMMAIMARIVTLCKQSGLGVCQYK